ncbi:MAG: elongation factor G [Pseudomonadota bacterium]|nr:elongation factor G [Pseudomonadota bacterium]
MSAIVTNTLHTTVHGTGGLRNIGISAHIDAGKTTLSERILYYTGRIHRTGEVHARDGTGATLDFDPLERQKGITIQAAATWCEWAVPPEAPRHTIQLLDTPGHVDFTIEVERALRVLDGAVLVVCAVAGVQPQTATVDRQMRRHGVPRVVFVNKMDRPGADPVAAVAGLRKKLGLHCAVLQLPVGGGPALEGVIDLVTGRMLRFEGAHGEEVVDSDVPDALRAEVAAAREALVTAVAEVDDATADRWLAGLPVDAESLHAAIRRATVADALAPVLFGAAYHNVGVQPLLDAVVRYLPSPLDRVVEGRTPPGALGGASVPVAADPEGPLVALAFKQDETRFGTMSWLRIYRGRLAKGDTARIMGTGDTVRIARLVRIHADSTVEIASAEAGDIVAAFGVALPTGDTLADPAAPLVLAGLEVPAPVVAVAVEAHDRHGAALLTAALARLCRADPTLRLDRDAESGQILLRGMGELHLEVALERVRAAGVAVRSGPPQVALRETVRRAARFDYTLRKQTGGPGQYARVIGRVEPLPEDPLGYAFVDATYNGAIPAPFVAAFERGVRDALTNGRRTGSPVVGVRVVLEDGAIHAVDSSERSFLAAGRLAVQEALADADPVVLEPVMRVVVEAPAENLGSVLGQLATRRGLVTDTKVAGEAAVVEAEVPLTTMFGYISALRSATRGGGSFVMEPLRYAPAP